MTEQNKDLSETLTPQEIDTSLPLRDEVQARVMEIYNLNFLSQTSRFSKTLPRLALELSLTDDELQMLINVLRVKEESLKSSGIGALASAKSTWSPSDVLDNMDIGEKEPDWREKQLPPRDRD